MHRRCFDIYSIGPKRKSHNTPPGSGPLAEHIFAFVIILYSHCIVSLFAAD